MERCPSNSQTLQTEQCEFSQGVSSIWVLLRKESESLLAMAYLKSCLFIVAIIPFFLARALAQNSPSVPQKGPPSEQQAPYEVQLSSKVAESLLVHKEEPACQKDPDGIKVMGTVVIAITIDKNGEVSHTRILSGPRMLRPLALATVRKYRYKPYLLNRKPVEVETIVSIQIDCIFHTGQA